MEDPELEFQIAGTHAELEEAKALRLSALREASSAEGKLIADLKPIDSRIQAVQQHLDALERLHQGLTIRAPNAGLWVPKPVEEMLSARLARGTDLGQVINPESFQFIAVVSQEEALRLFGQEIVSAQVRLSGQFGHGLQVGTRKMIPADQFRLPSAALGWQLGGEIPLNATDRSGMEAKVSFFQLQATVVPDGNVKLLHGRSGKIRFDLAPEPLLPQWVRKVRQLLQKRYSL